MNQLCKLDFWGYWNYLGTSATINNTVAQAYLLKSSEGLLSGDSFFTIKHTSSATPLNSINFGETQYNVGGLGTYKSAYLSNLQGGIQATSSLISSIQNGFEIHLNSFSVSTYNVLYAFSFVFGGTTYYAQWTTTGLELRTSGGNLFTVVSNANADNAWSSQKLRATVTGIDGAKILNVKMSGSQGVNNVLAYAQFTGLSGGFTALKTIPTGAAFVGLVDNISVYAASSGDASTIQTNWATDNVKNDMLPFQRYLPMLDIARVGGTGWTDTDDVEDPDLAYGDLVDGNLTTFATTATTNPIGLDGTASLGTLLGNGYYWTPGGASPTQMPTIGIIRSLQNSKYQLASTEAETVRTKFGDGTDSITFDNTSGAVESGETIVNTVFSDNGTFSDGVDSVVIDTDTTLRSTIELT